MTRVLIKYKIIRGGPKNGEVQVERGAPVWRGPWGVINKFNKLYKEETTISNTFRTLSQGFTLL